MRRRFLFLAQLAILGGFTRADQFVILLIQRNGLMNADASPMRKTLQELAVAGVKK